MSVNAKRRAHLSEAPLKAVIGKTTNRMFLRELNCNQVEAIQFYQEEFARMAFLHPICHKYLVQEHIQNGIIGLPATLESLVISKECISLDEKHMKRYKYLNHLP